MERTGKVMPETDLGDCCSVPSVFAGVQIPFENANR